MGVSKCACVFNTLTQTSKPRELRREFLPFRQGEGGSLRPLPAGQPLACLFQNLHSEFVFPHAHLRAKLLGTYIWANAFKEETWPERVFTEKVENADPWQILPIGEACLSGELQLPLPLSEEI